MTTARGESTLDQWHRLRSNGLLPQHLTMPNFLLNAMSGLALAVLASACATVPRSTVVQPQAEGPAISPSLVPPQGRFLKRKVAVARFSNETTYGKSPLIGKDILGKQASDIMVARLAASEKFILFDIEGSGNSLTAADFHLIGSVTEFGRTTTSDTGVFSKTRTQTARAAVSVRLVDARTGIVVFSAEGRGEASSETGRVLGVGTSQGFDSTLSERAISAAISSVVGNVAERMLDSPWRSQVLDTAGVECTIGGGRAQGLLPGDRLTVLRRGRTVANPQTGAQIELPGSPVAEIEIRQSHGSGYADEFSTCALLSGSLADIPVAELIVQAPEGYNK